MLGRSCFRFHLTIGPLAAEPKGEGGDLRGPEVDVDSVEVVGEY